MPSPQIGVETPGVYYVNDNTCWANHTYTCIQQSIATGHQAKEQYYQISNIPPPNIFPNQKGGFNLGFGFDCGKSQWNDNGEFFFKSVLPFATNWNDPELNCGIPAWTDGYRKQWNVGDNRDPIMKEIIVAIALSHLNIRNSFMIKERAIKRDWAYRKLELIKKGEDTTLIPIIQPEQSGNISWGGMPKIINTF